MEIFEGWPLPAAIAVLFVIVLLRAGGTYALGRGSRAGVKRLLERRGRMAPQLARAEAVIERFGSPVVALSFLTVGFQTAVNLAAGVLRMPLAKYIPALLVGGAMWATLYGVLGLATVNAILQAAERNPVAAVLSVLGVAVLLGLIEFATRRARAFAAAQTDATEPRLPDEADAGQTE
ncbi:DedA family protein [Agromyces aurantiacus]|uniref:DedA family protein n=1 Tax=Agromyces aurantiacus TaxID=165814 RepID=A0ABV9R2L4_9MICO|nr:VTT domain-containing protein [Agromyces aurantiacus]MBM7503028.1 membrane protein DedA with SNARE-associated domain [Agromyces aurantiacus]